jgi:MFS family permease
MPTGSPEGYRWRLAALSFAVLLPSLSISAANVALPSLGVAFRASTQEVQWVVISYLVALMAFLVTAGRIGDLLGRRRLLLAGIGLFALAAAGAALAPNLWVLIAARAVQGIGAAIMLALTTGAVADIMPRQRIGSAMGLLGTVSAIGTALGPSAGGLTIAIAGWQGVFALMVAAGVVSLGLAYRHIPADHARSRGGPFDGLGALLLVAAVGFFALAATVGPPTFNNLVLAGLSAAGAVLFVLVETRAAAPLVQLRLLRERGIGAGLVSIALASAIVMTTLVVGPFYLSAVLGLDPVATGIVMSVGPSVSALVGVPAGRLIDRLGSSSAIFTGLVALLSGTVVMAVLAPSFGVAGYVTSLAIITSGYALFQAANNTVVMGIAGEDQRGVIAALLALARNLGLIVGASAMGTVFALGSRDGSIPWLSAGGDTGLRVTFLVAAGLAGLALVAWWRTPSRA